MQEVGFIIICHQSSRTYQMMENISKQWTIPSMAWKNILIKTCHDLGSFHIEINMKLVEL